MSDAITPREYVTLRAQIHEARLEGERIQAWIAAEKTCRNCRHWEEGLRKGRGTCDAISKSEGDHTEERAVMVWEVYDDSGIEISLVTAADFGCILWVGK